VGHCFALVPLAGCIGQEDLWRLWRLACLDLYHVNWLRSIVARDGQRMLCWYEAPDAESVRFVLRQQGLAGAAVYSGRLADDTRNCAIGDAQVVVECRLDNAGDEAARALAQAAVVDALAAAGYPPGQVFTASGALVRLVAGDDAAGVSACLRNHDLAPGAVWYGRELDPRPPTLFEPAADTRTSPPGSDTLTLRSESRATGQQTADATCDAAIIGAGLSGICALERMLRMGLRVRLYEAGSDVGGVWHWNRYPGARIDSESYTYGFSFQRELLRDWQWRELFAAQPEMEQYLRFVVDRLGLRQHMRFDTRVASAHYDESAQCWRLQCADGEQVTARYLIAATGSLDAAQLPDYPGRDTFAGASCHTARWPAGGVDLAGRRVGVIGTGASGVQVIQAIASQVRQLTVFQRTPSYCIPQRNRSLTDADRLRIERDWDDILASCRASFAGFIHDFDPTPGLTLPRQAREDRFERLWQTPGFAFWLGNYGDLLMNDDVNEHACEFLRRKIRERVHDGETARRLLPDHPFGAKRVPLENGYYETYNRPNVRLVDLRETPIRQITPAGVLTTGEEHLLDVLIYATGFDAGTGALARIDVRGEGGQRLSERWREGPRTFLGLLVAGFPNLFIVNGPHNAAALCNAGRCIEQNVDWIAGCIEHLRERGCRSIAPSATAEAQWTRHVEDVADATVLSRMKHSWFYGGNTPGKPQRVGIYAGGARQFHEQCEAVAMAGYAGCILG